MAHYFFQNYEIYRLYCIVRKSENQDRNSCYNCKENVLLNIYTFSLNLIAAYRLISELVVIQFTDRIHLELSDRRSFSFFRANHKK